MRHHLAWLLPLSLGILIVALLFDIRAMRGHRAAVETQNIALGQITTKADEILVLLHGQRERLDAQMQTPCPQEHKPLDPLDLIKLLEDFFAAGCPQPMQWR